jgi:putative spermidine/putrescine transport system permease protein
MITTELATNARTRIGPGFPVLTVLLAPALVVVLGLFGGGLFLGGLQSLGHLPAAGMTVYSIKHFNNIITDPDFLKNLGLTFYISSVSTVIAAVIGVMAAMVMTGYQTTRRAVDFVFQIPLTVPHLVVATAFIFLLAPSGLVSRALQTIGLIDNPSQFPLMVNDPWGIGILITYVWKEVPFITLMVLSVLNNQGTELLEAARALHANRWQRFRYVVLPIIFPSLGAASLIVFAYTFGAFEVPYLLGQTYPMTMPVWAYRNFSDIDLMARPEGIATGVIITVVVAVAIVLSQVLIQAARRRGVIL